MRKPLTIQMDDLDDLYDGDLFIIVEPLSQPTCRISKSYNEAVDIRQKHTDHGIIIMLTHDTIQKLKSENCREVSL